MPNFLNIFQVLTALIEAIHPSPDLAESMGEVLTGANQLFI